MTIIESVEGDFSRLWDNHIKPFFTADVEPTLKLFIGQFQTQFGQQAITAALGSTAALAAGQPFGVIATGLAATLAADATADAETNATLDANTILQTVQSALQVAKVANGVQTPADQTAAASLPVKTA